MLELCWTVTRRYDGGVWIWLQKRPTRIKFGWLGHHVAIGLRPSTGHDACTDSLVRTFFPLLFHLFISKDSLVRFYPGCSRGGPPRYVWLSIGHSATRNLPHLLCSGVHF